MRDWILRSNLWCTALCATMLGATGGVSAQDAPAPAPADPGYLHIVAVAPGYQGRAPMDDRWIIYLEGFIDSGAAARLAGLFDRRQIDRAIVFFNSPGGHLVEAMGVGRLLRQRGFDTDVGGRAPDSVLARPGVCYSACPFAYAGGVRRSLEPGSMLGVHRAANNVPVPDDGAFQGVVSDQTAGYLAEMGISQDLLAIMSEVSHDSIRELTREEAERLGLLNSSLPPAAATPR
jgi:hypothetical protein